MRVLSFNIRYDNEEDGEDSWTHRHTELAQRISALNAAIIGIQEALVHQLHTLERELNEAAASDDHQYRWVGVGRTDGELSGEFAPILYQPAVVTLADWGTFWLSNTPMTPGSSFAEARLPRLVTWARFNPNGSAMVSHDGRWPQQFYVFNTHFDHGPDVARDKSARLLLRQISAIAGLYPSIVMGDFNATPSSNCYRIITSSFLQDTRVHAQEDCGSAAIPTFTGWVSKADRAASLEINPDREWIIIDYILVSGWHTLTYSVDVSYRANGRALSDHRAITACLSPMYYQ